MHYVRVAKPMRFTTQKHRCCSAPLSVLLCSSVFGIFTFLVGFGGLVGSVQIKLNAISIMSVNACCRCSAVAAFASMRLSLTVNSAKAFLPALAALA